MADRIGVGGRVDPPNTRQYAAIAASDFSRPRIVDNRFHKRTNIMLRNSAPLDNKSLYFEMKGEAVLKILSVSNTHLYFFF